jgi:legumain
MRKSGIPADHIILMMQDDVANSNENPFRGKLYNKMGKDVPEVYEGCQIDYKGNIVTAELFTKVITGDESAGGKVLKSGPNDRVFLNFIDHGGVGIIAFPNGPLLHAKDLSTALKAMQSKKMFNELVFYMEACESGSMFPDLTTDGKIYAVTAANAQESSWGYYCAPQDTVNGKHLGTCLGDLFSIAWMEDSDLGQFNSESLATQVRRVTARTSKSHVTTFGDKSFTSENIGNFELGETDITSLSPAFVDGGAVNARDIHLQYYQARWAVANTTADKAEAWKHIQKTLADHKDDVSIFTNIARRACEGPEGTNAGCFDEIKTGKDELKDLDCHKKLVDVVHEKCPVRSKNNAGGWNSFNTQFSQLLVNLCESSATSGKGIQALQAIVEQECTRTGEVVI